jgi:methionine synthase II (cobalamin-independent)
MKILGNCRAMGIGSVPFTDGKQAWEVVLEHFKEIPFWPQLPKRTYLENMYTQFGEHLPGSTIDADKQTFFIERSVDLQSNIESFYNDYLTKDLKPFSISRDYIEGIYSGIELKESNDELFNGISFIKGQITGPVSFGLQVVDQDKKSIYYDEMFHDILLKNLERIAQWQEMMLGKICENIILSVDEPYLSSIGSGVINLNRERVIEDIETVFQAINCHKATHCCGNTDWSLLMETSADILLFDAYNYTTNLALFSSDLQEFFERGGCVGWGIVPTSPPDLESTNKAELISSLEQGIAQLEAKGIARDVILQHSFITPACGLGTLTIPLAVQAIQLTAEIAEYMQRKYELV